jgi:IS5 family transposase
MAIQLGILDRLESLDKLTRLGDPLATLAKIVPFTLFREDLPTREPSPKGGRPPIDGLLLLKLLVIQHLYRLSDEQLEYQTLDRLSFQRFAGIHRIRDVPDFTTVWRFRERLGEDGVRKVFAKLESYIMVAGYKAAGGQIVDATIVQTGKPRRDPDESTVPTVQEAAHQDDDAAFTMKRGKSYYGYKLHVNVDEAHGFVRGAEVTPANTHDGHVLDAVVNEVDGRRSTAVYADAAYPSADNTQMLAQKDLKPKFAHKRKPGRQLTKRQKEQNRRWSGVRARVEHVFAHQNGHKPGGRWVRVVGLVRVTVKLLLDQVAYNLNRLSFVYRRAQGSCA